MKRITFLALIIACLASFTLFASADWLQFRGPGGLGIAADKDTPVAWSNETGIAWKYAMPGAGGSCPIVVGDKVLVTCYSGYGVDKNEPGDQKNLSRHLLCLERKTGKLLWRADFPAPLPDTNYGGFQAYHGYASNTPVSDGKLVWLFLGKGGVYCYDLDGKEKWHVNVGSGTHGWGSGTSPVLHKDLVIVNASVESNSLIALDKTSGKEVWKTKGMSESWNTPVLMKLANGTIELAVAARHKMLGFDPDTGRELWNADTYNWYVCPSIVGHDGVFYGLQHTICVAVKAGGRGDVTESHVLWKKNVGAVVSSPLFHEGHLYWAANGSAHCIKASDGSTAYKERLKSGGDCYASPVLADGKLYYVSRTDGAYVVAAAPKFDMLAHNTLDKSIFNANPAVSNSQLFLRSDRFLYCIGKK